MAELVIPEGYEPQGYGKTLTCVRCGARVDVKRIGTHDAWHAAAHQ